MNGTICVCVYACVCLCVCVYVCTVKFSVVGLKRPTTHSDKVSPLTSWGLVFVSHDTFPSTTSILIGERRGEQSSWASVSTSMRCWHTLLRFFRLRRRYCFSYNRFKRYFIFPHFYEFLFSAISFLLLYQKFIKNEKEKTKTFPFCCFSFPYAGRRLLLFLIHITTLPFIHIKANHIDNWLKNEYEDVDN